MEFSESACWSELCISALHMAVMSRQCHKALQQQPVVKREVHIPDIRGRSQNTTGKGDRQTKNLASSTPPRNPTHPLLRYSSPSSTASSPPALTSRVATTSASKAAADSSAAVFAWRVSKPSIWSDNPSVSASTSRASTTAASKAPAASNAEDPSRSGTARLRVASTSTVSASASPPGPSSVPWRRPRACTAATASASKAGPSVSGMRASLPACGVGKPETEATRRAAEAARSWSFILRVAAELKVGWVLLVQGNRDDDKTPSFIDM
ncbi:hypothetical protein BT67DRAFT_54580 [Trichocladium antarcticum]|uniref:Uncharacterized protein n=1 Tax=Trichocladium antarcticum TaxID=1450529 RepID=A0AAN6UIM0_9PEZI|nr:hypothetical protein BT67DRAFT_54580 [Trichocladium antarcticum]